MFAHRLGRALTRMRKSEEGALAASRRQDARFPSIYEDNKPVGITVVVTTQHAEGVRQRTSATSSMEEGHPRGTARRDAQRQDRFLINPTGRFVVGGPQGDTGLTGRKIIVDTYGGWGRHGGGAFSGKDPSKVDRSAAYMGRWVAKNVVAAGLATALRGAVRLRHRLA